MVMPMQQVVSWTIQGQIKDSVAPVLKVNRSQQAWKMAPNIQPAVINRSKSRAVGTRALWFALAFLWTYLMDNIVVMMWYTTGMWVKGLAFIAAVVFPLQGFINLTIFIHRRKRMKTREGQNVRRILCCMENISSCWEESCCCDIRGEAKRENLDSTKSNDNGFAVDEEESRIFQVLGTS